MNLLKAQLERIQRQLAGLSASQKMLTAALATIMVITVVWWGKYAGEAEMTALLPQAFSPADMGRIQERLSEKDIHFTVVGDKIMVPTDRRMEILSDLTYSRVMPRNMQEGFDQIIKQMSPFDPESNREKLWNHGKEMLLSEIISKFPDVAQADVILDPTGIQRIEGAVEPSATVNISLRDGAKVTGTLADAAATAVAGAQSGIALSKIKVIINGMAQKVRDSESPLANGSDQLALLQQNEAWVEEKVRRTYSDIPGLLVNVTMKLNTTTTQMEKHDYDGKNAIQKTKETNTDTDEQTGPAGGSVEPGAVPNVALSTTNGGGGATQSQSHEKNNEKLENFVPETRVSSRTPAGDAHPVSATVRVPLSFSRDARSRDPATKDPTYAQLMPLIQEETVKMRDGVAHCVMLASPTDVSIDTYVDATPTLAVQAVAASSSSAVSLLMGGHAKEIALGALAVMSLFMASMMVRKAAPLSIPAMRVAESAPSSLLSSDALTSEAASGDPLMDGLELNDETVKARQVVDQVSTMVRDNPDAAAALVKRWLSRT